MRQALAAMDPEALMRTWMPIGVQGMEQAQKLFWSQFARGSKGRDKEWVVVALAERCRARGPRRGWSGWLGQRSWARDSRHCARFDPYRGNCWIVEWRSGFQRPEG